MKLEQLRQHPAYLALTDDERAAVDERLESWHLDASAVAATTGGLDQLEVADLRFWLASTGRRPWARISLVEQPERATAMFEAMLDAAAELGERADRPELVDLARELCRAFVVAEQSKAEVGFVREEQAAAIIEQLEQLAARVPAWTMATVLELGEQVGLAGVSAALRGYLSETRGVRGLFDRVGDRLRNHAFNLVHGGLYLVTGEAEHEGQEKRGKWRNWTADYEARPRHFRYPGSEDELCTIVAEAGQLRAVGGGHSFNPGPLSDDTMISLDNYDRILELDLEGKRCRAQAGVRLRDLNAALWEVGLGLPLLGSTDAQSVAGLVATDLHGTGRDHGFLSEQLLSLRVIAADGSAQTVRPGDPLFHATIGAIGTCGVVAEVELALVDAYHLEKRTEMVDRKQVESAIADLLAANDHLSFYYVGGSDESESVRTHIWNRTTAPLTEHWERHKLRSELSDFAMSAFVPGIAEAVADIDEDSWLSNVLAPDEALVMPGSRGFGRKLFYRHDEIEFGVPFEDYQACLADILSLLRKHDYFSIIEIRFAPERSQALIGPGVGRRTAFIELATPLSQPRGEIFAIAEDILRSYGGQPHLGKKTNMSAQDMLETYGDRFRQFQAVRARQDPEGKFLNAFCRQLFGAV